MRKRCCIFYGKSLNLLPDLAREWTFLYTPLPHLALLALFSSCNVRALCISNQSFDNGPMTLIFLHCIISNVAS